MSQLYSVLEKYITQLDPSRVSGLSGLAHLNLESKKKYMHCILFYKKKERNKKGGQNKPI